MRRMLLLGLCVLEMGAVLLLVRLGLQIPNRTDLEKSFQEAEKVTFRAREQIIQVRKQVKNLRQPQVEKVAQGLEKQLKKTTALLKKQQIDVETLVALRDSLGSISTGVKNFEKVLDADTIAKLGAGLEETATYLDEELSPSANKAADQLDKSLEQLKKHTDTLACYLEKSTINLQPLKDMHDGLGKFSTGLDKLQSTLENDRFKNIQNGFEGMDEALNSGARQVEHLAGYTYPVVTFEGFKPYIEKREFWPRGAEIARGMRKAHKGVQAAHEQMGVLIKNLPEIRTA